MGRRREDWAEVAEAWKRSGETQRSFAAHRGVSLGALQSWIYRLRRQRPATKLVEVRVSRQATPPPSPAEVALPSGVTLRLAPGTDPAWASSLVKALL